MDCGLDDSAGWDRSFARIINRSGVALARGSGATVLRAFRKLDAYPADAMLETELLADLWRCRGTEARLTARGPGSAPLPIGTCS